jgi:leucyl-tRNA synthetase
VPEEELPILLPDDVEWLPTGESPLKLHPTWKNANCPKCGKASVRETDTMDTFMCSSWYHLRYLSPHYDRGPFDPAEYAYWMPVDTYTGGIEHATMHLIYTRFFHKACRDMGITQGWEPMSQLRNQGIILGEDSEKMSKSRGNVEAPDELVRRYGADTIRAYLIFFARWEQGGPWNSNGIEGSARWLKRVWALFIDADRIGSTGTLRDIKGGMDNSSVDEETRPSIRSLRRKVHQTLRQLTHDFENFEFNTIVSGLMELLNEMTKAKEMGAAGTAAWAEAQDIYLRMLAPVAPHIAEELWMRLGKPYSVHQQPWPEVDEEAATEEQVVLVIQVNGKVRDRIMVPVDIGEEEAKSLALESEFVKMYLIGKSPHKVIVVPGRLVNVVV